MPDALIFDLRQHLPAHHRKWVRTAFAFVAAGYLGVSLLHWPESTPFEIQELVMLGVCTAAFFLEPHQPRVAASTVLAGVWLEMMLSYLISDQGIRCASSVALPLLVIGTALLLGGRAAWLMALGTSIVLPTMLLCGRALELGPGIVRDDLTVLFVVLVTLFGSASLLSLFLTTLASLVRKERAQAARLGQFIEQAPDAIIAVNEDGFVAAFNRLAEEYLELSRHDILGQPLAVLQNRFPQVFPSGTASSPGHPTRLTINARHLEARIRRQRLDSGTIHLIYVLRDVTEHEEANQSTAALRTQINQMQKMDAIGHLAGGVAHDFNNLLTAVSGAAHALHDSTPQETAEIAEELQEAAEHGAALTRQLLTFARKDVVQAQVLSLPKVLNASYQLITRLLGERIRLDVVTTSDCHIKMDEGQLQQVLLNLAANSRDAISGEGVFSLKCSRAGGQVILTAEDNGCGMDASTIERIFEPFFTTKGSEKGTGLGLSTTFGIVRQSGGVISVHSKPGNGSRFTIRWPLVARPDEVPPSTHRTLSQSSNAGRILLVEDNESARRFVRRILRNAGYDVSEATNGQQALDLFQSGLQPDMLVSDVMMPGMSGVDLATRIHQCRQNLPVLFVSGYVDDVLSDCPYDPTQDLLLKPFSAGELVGRVEAKLRGAQTAVPLSRAPSVPPA